MMEKTKAEISVERCGYRKTGIRTYTKSVGLTMFHLEVDENGCVDLFRFHRSSQVSEIISKDRYCPIIPQELSVIEIGEMERKMLGDNIYTKSNLEVLLPPYIK